MLRILFNCIRLMWFNRHDFKGYGIGIFKTGCNIQWFKGFEFMYPDQSNLEFWSVSDLEP